VGGEEDRRSGSDKLKDDVADDFGVERVKSAEWFVEKQQLGAGDDCGDELDFLAHSLGEAFDFPVGAIGELETV
jgi:hypothetical protein